MCKARGSFGVVVVVVCKAAVLKRQLVFQTESKFASSAVHVKTPQKASKVNNNQMLLFFLHRDLSQKL